MELKELGLTFSICKLDSLKDIDLNNDFMFLSKTDKELSLVCPVSCVPQNVLTKDDGWKGFRIEGILDFSLIGILSKISTILSEEKIGIFVVSTYNTDYIFIKEENYDRAIFVLSHNGYTIVS